MGDGLNSVNLQTATARSDYLSINMKPNITFVAFFLVSTLNCALAAPTTTTIPQRINKDLSLTKPEISALEMQAESGNNEAAVKLARYYDFYVRDYQIARFWFEKAARNGHVQSQYNLGVRLMTKRKDAASCIEAQFWFQMALENGLLKARAALDELGQCPVPKAAPGPVLHDAG